MREIIRYGKCAACTEFVPSAGSGQIDRCKLDACPDLAGAVPSPFVAGPPLNVARRFTVHDAQVPGSTYVMCPVCSTDMWLEEPWQVAEPTSDKPDPPVDSVAVACRAAEQRWPGLTCDEDDGGPNRSSVAMTYCGWRHIVMSDGSADFAAAIAHAIDKVMVSFRDPADRCTCYPCEFANHDLCAVTAHINGNLGSTELGCTCDCGTGYPGAAADRSKSDVQDCWKRRLAMGEAFEGEP